MQITIEIKNTADLELIFAFLKRLGAKIIDQKQNIQNSSPLVYLEELAEQGGIESISDPSEWQKETREGNILTNKEL